MVNLLLTFLLALVLGAFIGLEREYARIHKRGHDYGGIRTFPLIALFGALAAYFGELITPWIIVVALAVLGAIIAVAYFLQAEKKHIGATTEIAGILTFFIGLLTYHQQWKFAVVLTITMAILLHARSVLHHFAKKITKKELRDTLLFAFIAFVLLPFLPNEWYGPLQLFNPYVTWLMVVLVSGISFLGYALMKWFGDQGVALTGALGGLASSTAVTISFAQQSLKKLRWYRAFALAVMIANGVMFIRVLVEVFIVNRLLFVWLLLPLGVLSIICAGISLQLWKGLKHQQGEVMLNSPFTLWPALKFSLLFALTLALIKIADVYISSQGVYVVSVLSGLADVDAVTVSLSQLAKTTLEAETAARGILLATLMNTLFKGSLALWFGGPRFRKIIALSFLTLLVVGGVFVVVM